MNTVILTSIVACLMFMAFIACSIASIAKTLREAKDWYVSKVDGKICNAKFMEKTPTNQARKLEIEKAAMSATGIIEQEEWFIKGAEWSDKNPSYISSEKQRKKSAGKVKPKFKHGDRVVNKKSDLEQTLGSCIEDVYEGAFPFRIEDQDDWELVEQKPTDKIEPKFHEGDWTVSNLDGKTRRISEVHYDEYNIYYVVDGNSVNLEEYDRLHHLWTIADAKDGDVLANNNGWVGVFNFLHSDDFTVYCFITRNMSFYSEFCVYDTLDPLFYHIHPATKEQRDLLFQKIKESGYEWDAESKELKKIEQIPADKIGPIFNVGDKIRYSKGCGTIMTIEKIENGEYIFANNMGHTTIESGNKWYLVEQKSAELGENKSKERSLSLQIQAYLNTASDELYAKGKPLYSEKRIEDIHKCMLMWQKLHNAYFYQKPTWSEEDENYCGIIQRILNFIKENGRIPESVGKTDRENATIWLESLRERVQLQPKQEWSEEDRDYYDAIIAKLEVTQDDALLTDNQMRFLKSLIPQNRWKPSDEQIKALDDAIANCSERYCGTAHRLISLKQDLNKLMEE